MTFGADEASTDPYTDPETGILRNLVGATTAAELARAEADLGTYRLMELVEDPVSPTYDLAHLQEIHRRLFQDVYDWAGQLRTVDIRKNEPGAVPFMPVSRVSTGADYAFGDLADDNHLRDMARDQLTERLAHHYDQINHLHPFREGNGRTQRVFWDQCLDQAGWAIDWRNIDARENNQASRAGAESDLTPLQAMFDRELTDADDAEMSLEQRLALLELRTRTRTERQAQAEAADYEPPWPPPPEPEPGNGYELGD